MKEEKDYRPKEKRVTLLTPQGATSSGGGTSGDYGKGDDKQDRNKEKKEALSKVSAGSWPGRGRDGSVACGVGPGMGLPCGSHWFLSVS